MRTKASSAVGLAVLAASTVALGQSSGGSISGKVTYVGTPAKQMPIDMSRNRTAPCNMQLRL